MAGKFFEELEVASCSPTSRPHDHRGRQRVLHLHDDDPQPLHLDFHAAGKAEFRQAARNSLLTLASRWGSRWARPRWGPPSATSASIASSSRSRSSTVTPSTRRRRSWTSASRSRGRSGASSPSSTGEESARRARDARPAQRDDAQAHGLMARRSLHFVPAASTACSRRRSYCPPTASSSTGGRGCRRTSRRSRGRSCASGSGATSRPRALGADEPHRPPRWPRRSRGDDRRPADGVRGAEARHAGDVRRSRRSSTGSSTGTGSPHGSTRLVLIATETPEGC